VTCHTGAPRTASGSDGSVTTVTELASWRANLMGIQLRGEGGMTDQKRTTTKAGATELSEEDLGRAQGGYTATDDLWQVTKKAGKKATIIGGFKSASGLESDTE
jgi:hypothetical protein